MNYHVFQKETFNMCFSHKKKQIKKSQKRERMSGALHNFHDSKPFALLAFQDEGCMHLHPKNHVQTRPLGCRFLFIYQFPKSNVLSFKFRMRGPLKESTSCFLIRLIPLVLVPIGLFHRTQRPLLYDFMGLKVLTFIFHRTQSPRLYLSQDSKSLPLSFIELKFLTFIFHRTQSPCLYLS